MEISRVSLICTIGPSCCTEVTLSQLKAAGVDIFRINLSHASLEDIYKYCDIAKKIGITIGIDTEGAQLRTKLFSGNTLQIKKDDYISVGELHKFDNVNHQLSLYPSIIYKKLRIGHTIRVDFNGALLRVIDIKDESFKCVAIAGGIVGHNKGADILNDYIDLPDFTEKDLEAVAIARDLGIVNIFVSFCKSVDAIRRLRESNENVVITSKIESKLSIHSLDAICAESDAILIDRGDLTREINILDIPFAQKGIIQVAVQFGKPCFVATNVLESLIDGNLPTRAEINDIVNTLEMGASGLVLAAETAIGKKPVLCAEIVTELAHRNKLYHAGLLFADIDRNEITDSEMMLWLNRISL